MITFRTLGGIDLRDDAGEPIRPLLTQPKRLALLASLALPGSGTFQRRDVLIARLWPELDEARGRGALNTSVHFLRQALGKDVVISRGQEELGLDPALIECDAPAFEAAHRRADHAEAARLYGGDLLEGFYADDAAEFERWVEGERLRLRQLALDGARAARAAAGRSGDAAEQLAWSRRICDLVPLDETELVALLRALRDVGRRSEAIAAFERFRARAAADLDEEPSAATVALVASLPPDDAAPADDQPPLAAPLASAARAAAPAAWWTAPRIATAALAGVGAAVAWFGLSARTPAPPDRDRVAVLPFQVHGDSSLAYLEEGIVDLLGDRLALPGRLYPVDARAVLLAERERERGGAGGAPVGGATAARLGAGLFVVGSVARIDTTIQLAASLNETNGERRATALVTVAGEHELFAGLDEIARRLVAELYSDAPQRLDRTAALTTSSLPALRAYLAAERDFRQGHFDAALAGFTRAIELDSSMAIAYYAAAVAAEWTGRGDLSAPTMERAWQLRDRLPEPERLLVTARHAGSPAERLRLFRAALGTYPDLIEARYEVADVLFHYGHWGVGIADVRAAFEAVLAFDPNHPDARIHLARIAAVEGDSAALSAEIAALEAGTGDRGGERGIEARALRAAAFGSPASMAASIAEMRRLAEEPLVRMSSRLARYGARVDRVEPLFRSLESAVHAPETRAFARVMRATLRAAGGQPRAALELLNIARSPAARVTVAGRGVVATMPGITLPAGDLAETRKLIREWAGRPAATRTIASGYIELLADTATALFGMLDGQLSAQLGDLAAAEDAARRLGARGMPEAAALVRSHAAGDAARVLSAIGRSAEKQYYDVTAGETYLRARALLALGDSAEADRWFGAFTYEHPFAFVEQPAAWLARARIADAAGRTEDAVRLYGRFVDAWEGAEPQQAPLLREARARLAQLRMRE